MLGSAGVVFVEVAPDGKRTKGALGCRAALHCADLMLPKENGLRNHLLQQALLIGGLVAVKALVELEQCLCRHSQAH